MKLKIIAKAASSVIVLRPAIPHFISHGLISEELKLISVFSELVKSMPQKDV